jgi:thioesterase domain-containing protein
VFCYRELAQALGADQPVLGIQASHAASHAPELTTIEGMAEAYLQRLQALQPTGPYKLGGWSMGGVVAFEIARRLRQRGEQVALLALMEAHLPEAGRPDPMLEDSTLPLLTLALDLGVPMARLDAVRQALADRQGGRGDAAEALLALVRAEGVLPGAITAADVRRHLAIIERNLKAFRSYHPGAYEGACTVFRAEEHPEGPALRRDLGWGRWARSVEVHDMKGDHFSILRPPFVGELALRLKAELVPLAAVG